MVSKKKMFKKQSYNGKAYLRLDSQQKLRGRHRKNMPKHKRTNPLDLGFEPGCYLGKPRIITTELNTQCRTEILNIPKGIINPYKYETRVWRRSHVRHTSVTHPSHVRHMSVTKMSQWRPLHFRHEKWHFAPVRFFSVSTTAHSSTIVFRLWPSPLWAWTSAIRTLYQFVLALS